MILMGEMLTGTRERVQHPISGVGIEGRGGDVAREVGGRGKDMDTQEKHTCFHPVVFRRRLYGASAVSIDHWKQRKKAKTTQRIITIAPHGAQTM